MAFRTCSFALLTILSLSVAEGARAQGYSLLTGRGLASSRMQAPTGGFLGARQPLIQARTEVPDIDEGSVGAQSLFLGQSGYGFFAPLPERDQSGRQFQRPHVPLSGGDPQAAMVRHLIAQAEAGRDGYDAVQHGARRKTPRPPTQMTLGEIFAWIDATPGQPHAIGRYQFIPSTLARLVTILDSGPDELFSPELQDRLADILLQDAGYDAFRANEIGQTAFMNNLARIWAGLPTSSGRSHYHGYAGNAATMSWASFEEEMSRIFQG
ncbi:hypothetical protein [Palleronia sp.]|uniref:hypothetical protein n=1 Tax=Palleronia sp. TaxID=1940284 RepID=UPI0035C7F749